jgi:hypothetical protein
MRRKIFLAVAVLASCLLPLASIHAQTITAVSGTVLDPQGSSFAGGQVTINVVSPSGGVTPFVTATGATMIAPQIVSLSASGSFSVGVVANASISPASTTYTIRACPIGMQLPMGSATQTCVTATGITIAGASQDVSATLNALTVSQMQTWNPSRIFNTLPTAGTASLGATTMTTAPAIPATGTRYNLSSYISQTVLGASCAGNSTIVVNAIFQDPNAAAPQTTPIATYTVTTNGTLGIVPLTANVYSGGISFIAKPGTVVQYSTTYSPGGSCSPAPAVQFFPVLELQ